MALKLEIEAIGRKIQLFEEVLDCWNVKLFYLNNKRCNSEFLKNENRLEIIKASHRAELVKAKLHFLHGEYNLLIQLYLSECEQE
jgi:Fe-S cluster biosynthesis and repair protein YggX